MNQHGWTSFSIDKRVKGFNVGGDEIDIGKKKAKPAHVLAMSAEATFQRDCGGGVQMTIFMERDA